MSQLHLRRQHDRESRLWRFLRDYDRQKSGASASRRLRIRLAASGVAVLAAVLPGSSQAQDPDPARPRMLCALLGGDLSEPGGIAAFQRCLANPPAPRLAPAPSPVSSSPILDHPAPLGPGVNRGNVDNFGGGHTFYFFAGPGHVDAEMAFEEVGMFGSPLRQTMNFDFYTDDNKLASHNTIVSQGALARIHIDGDIASRERLRLLVTVQKGLVRLGGYYEIEVTGAVAFEGPTLGVGVQPIMSQPLVSGTPQPLVSGTLQPLVTTMPQPAGPDPAQRTFGCDGKIFRAPSKSVLGAVYGATNVSVEKVIGAEGESQTYETALFARRPAEKIRIEWSNSTNKVASDVDVFGSKWIGPGGIHVGSTIAEVGNANGRPFTFSGLGWDYGGQVRDWRGGALGPVKPTHGGPGNLPPDCRLDVQLDAASRTPEAAISAASGEQDIQSDDPKAIAAKIVVTKITFYYGAY
jgi:hypothetical protein